MKCKQIKKLLTKKFLIKEYINQKKSSQKIAKIVGCSDITILNYLRKYKIPIRDNHECHKGYKVSQKLKKYLSKIFTGEGNPNFGNGDKLRGKNNPFYGKHHTEKSKQLIGQIHKGKKYWLGKKHTEVTKKKMSELRIRLGLSKGKKNGRYVHGLAYEPYSIEFTEQLKESIRKRDNYTCQFCNKRQETYYRKLDVHHINYNKKNCNKNNLISLCSKCNTKVNANRDYYFAYFIYIMENYNGTIQAK